MVLVENIQLEAGTVEERERIYRPVVGEPVAAAATHPATTDVVHNSMKFITVIATALNGAERVCIRFYKIVTLFVFIYLAWKLKDNNTELLQLLHTIAEHQAPTTAAATTVPAFGLSTAFGRGGPEQVSSSDTRGTAAAAEMLLGRSPIDWAPVICPVGLQSGNLFCKSKCPTEIGHIVPVILSGQQCDQAQLLADCVITANMNELQTMQGQEWDKLRTILVPEVEHCPVANYFYDRGGIFKFLKLIEKD